MFSKHAILFAFFTLAPFCPAGTTDISVVPAAENRTATPDGWSDDFEHARKQAISESKDLLVAFSGSDWCSWCMILEENVLSQKTFFQKARENFVPVYVDLPQNKNRLSPAAKRQNANLAKHYRIKRFPAVLLIDADGDVIARTGYLEGGPEKFHTSLLKLREEGKKSPEYRTRKTLRALPQAPDRIQQLDTILKALPLRLQIANSEYVYEILAYDKDGSCGFRKNYPYFTDIFPLEQALNAELSRLERLTEETLSAHGKPKAKSEYVKIIVELVRANSEPLITLRERAKKMQKRFPKNTPEADYLNRILAELDRVFSLYFIEQAQSR